MEDQKLENLLNLALDASEREREKSLELSIGYDQEEKTWEVIVKYTGSLDVLREQGIEVVELLNGYAILNLRESQLEGLTQVETIEYIEKPFCQQRMVSLCSIITFRYYKITKHARTKLYDNR